MLHSRRNSYTGIWGGIWIFKSWGVSPEIGPTLCESEAFVYGKKETFDAGAFLCFVLTPVQVYVNGESEVGATIGGGNWRVVYTDK